jgi:mRNA-degrading endonuclease RelE of RelBE toxin-antitoxin system
MSYELVYTQRAFRDIEKLDPKTNGKYLKISGRCPEPLSLIDGAGERKSKNKKENQRKRSAVYLF